MNPTRFDRLAIAYEWLERVSFGPRLHRCRVAFLNELITAESILILGDGDGRFLRELLMANPTAQIDALDISPAMAKRAGDRIAPLPGAPDRVRFRVEDALEATFAAERYDTIVTNFFLDCFPERDLSDLIARLVPALKPGGRWIVGDFRELGGSISGPISRTALAGMYLFFKVTTRLPASELVDPDPILVVHGLERNRREESLGGFLAATLWRKPNHAVATNNPPDVAGDFEPNSASMPS